MTQASIFLNNRNQAVRLPKDMAFPEGTKSVEIVAVGNARLISPSSQAWDSFFDAKSVSEDFMADREQPEMQEREDF